ncbi:MAG: deoxyribonuclease IV [Patescibacteria group bacterium]|jgi:deoxyribonuclease-4
MKFGAHVSIAGGMQNAPLNAAVLGCEIFQMFSRSPQGGPAPKLTPEIVDEFRKNCEEHDLSEWVIHSPYYINFASPLPATRASSARIIREELERGTILGAAYVMFHPGSARETGEKEAVKLCVNGIKKVLDGYKGTTKLLIEISAGAGMIIGDTFEEVAELLEGVDDPELGVCFDTAHAFASGYDLRDAKSVEKTFKTFDSLIGLNRLKMSHCNDSKVGLGERRDRHEHLGEGHIGLAGFEAIVKMKKLSHMNLYLETEFDEVKRKHELQILKKFRGKK